MAASAASIPDLLPPRLLLHPTRGGAYHRGGQVARFGIPAVAGSRVRPSSQRGPGVVWRCATTRSKPAAFVVRAGSPGRSGVPELTSAAEEEAQLLKLLDAGANGGRVEVGRKETAAVENLVAQLELRQTSLDYSSPLLPGIYRLLRTYKPGEATADFFSLASWAAYLNGGPSPVQSLVISKDSVQNVYQVLRLDGPRPCFLNVVDFSSNNGPGILVLDAPIVAKETPRRLVFRFELGYFVLRTFAGRSFNPPLRLPYPVPFKLLGLIGKDIGWLETTYVSKLLRITRGNRGSIFVLKRVDDDESKSLSALLDMSKTA